MRIIIETNPNTIVTEHGDAYIEGSRLRWITTNHWNKLGKMGTHMVFEPLNEYFESLAPPHQDAIFNLYREAHAVFDDNMTFEENTHALKPIIAQLLACLNFEQLRTWLFKYGRIAYNADIRETHTGEYPERQTYLRDEYDELVVLAMMFKALVPIWATYLAGYSESRGKDYRDVAAFELVTESAIMELPAMERLKDYCEGMAEKNSKQFTPAICQRIGSDEIPHLFLSMAAVRRLAVGDIRNPERTLIKEVYKYLESTTVTFSKGVRDKRSTRGEGDEQESVSERYRISQTVPDMTVVETACDLEDVEFAVRALTRVDGTKDSAVKLMLRGELKALPEKTDLSADRVRDLAANMETNPQFSIADFHFQLAGIVLKDFISAPCLIQVPRSALLHAIALAAVVFETYGPKSLADLMLSGRTDLDYESSADMAGYAIREMSAENRAAVDALYPHLQMDPSGRTKPSFGLTAIQQIIEEINQYEWIDPGAISSTLRDDLAVALVEYLG